MRSGKVLMVPGMSGPRDAWAWARLALALLCGTVLAAAPSLSSATHFDAARSRLVADVAHAPAISAHAMLRSQLSPAPTADKRGTGVAALPAAAFAALGLALCAVVRRARRPLTAAS